LSLHSQFRVADLGEQVFYTQEKKKQSTPALAWVLLARLTHMKKLDLTDCDVMLLPESAYLATCDWNTTKSR